MFLSTHTNAKSILTALRMHIEQRFPEIREVVIMSYNKNTRSGKYTVCG